MLQIATAFISVTCSICYTVLLQ